MCACMRVSELELELLAACREWVRDANGCVRECGTVRARARVCLRVRACMCVTV
jgi:hypothetical protein